MHDGPPGVGQSRAAILEQCDASLRRLSTDWIDVYFLHRFDDAVPVERPWAPCTSPCWPGKGHLGASSMWAWQLAGLQTTALVKGWTPFAAMQDQHNRLKREEEREMLPMCADPWASACSPTPRKGRAG